MADNVTFTVDSDRLVSALRDFPDILKPRVMAAARTSAGSILSESQRRIARRTNYTAEHMRVDETYNGDGYVVVMGDAMAPSETRRRERIGGSRRWVNAGSYQQAHVGLYLEFGTQRMTARPFLFISGDLEVAAHDRRVRQAIQDGLNAEGLG